MLPAGATLEDMQPLKLWRKRPTNITEVTCKPAALAPTATTACVDDSSWVHGERSLPHTMWLNNPATTQESCAEACYKSTSAGDDGNAGSSSSSSSSSRQGFAYAGVEAGAACFCGQAFPTSVKTLPWSACKAMQCAGNSSESCGAGNTLLVYPAVCTPSGSATTTDGDVFATSSALLEEDAATSGFSVEVATLGLVYTKRPFNWVQSMYEGSFQRIQRGMYVCLK